MKALGLLAICLLLFGCVGGGSEADNATNYSVYGATPEAGFEDGLLPEESGGFEVESGSESSGGSGAPEDSPRWAGTFTVRFYGGETEKEYDMTLTSNEELFFDSETDAFGVLEATYTCDYRESSYVDLGGGFPLITMARTGSGSITKQYGGDEFRLSMNDDGSISGDFSEPNENWVNFAVTFDSESSTEEGGCLIENFGDIQFTEADYEFPAIDTEGRDSIRGQKSFTYGTANAVFNFEYHRVG